MSMPEIHAGEAPEHGEQVFAQSWPSRIDLKPEVIDVISRHLLSRGWVTADDDAWLQLCLDEVVVNAMLHGNEGDPNLLIEVRLFHAGPSWILQVTDQGEGFRAEQVPDPENPDSLLLEHGRGIRIMGEWLDRLTYYRSGAVAVLERRIAAPE